MIICDSVYDIINNRELNCNLRIKNKEKYFKEISNYQNDSGLYVYSFNDKSHYMLDKSGGGLDIDKVEPLSIKMLKEYSAQKSRNVREKSIINKFRHIAIGTEYNDEKYMNQILDNLHKVPMKDEHYKGESQIDLSKLRYGINQNGGVILKYLEEKMPSVTIILELIDIILIPVSSLPPPVGTVGDVVTIILAALRGEWAYVVASAVGLVPAVGDALGTVGKVMLKIQKMYILAQDEKTRYIASSLSSLLLILSGLSIYFASHIKDAFFAAAEHLPFP